MQKEKPRLARLTNILTQLQSKSLVTARQLAEKHQVSLRTIYRDIRTLEQSGVPIITEEGRGYSIMEGYQLPPIMFTESEAHALITAAQFINKNKDESFRKEYHSAITKIKSVLRYPQKEKIELLSKRLQIRENKLDEKTSNYLMKVQEAITNYQILKLSYLSLKEEESVRKIEPFALYSTQGNWIMVAFCQVRQAFRAFRLDCIQSLQSTSQYFDPHSISLQEYFESCPKTW